MNDTRDYLNRRELLNIGISAGFALAVSPVTGLAITTPATGIEAGTVRIPTDGGEMPAYRAMPKGKGPFPTVIVVHEIFGVHEYIQDVCRRLAKEGYLAISPYLYFRQGDVTKLKEIEEIRAQIISKVSHPQVMKDIDATIAYVVKEKKANPAKMAITGYCWGGTMVWLYTAHNPEMKAGVAWYGRLTGDPAPNVKYPFEIAATSKVPVLGLYGGKDRGIPLDQVDKMKALLKEAKSPSEIVVYPEADHGFHADYRPSYNEAAATDGWSKLLAWFKKNGVK